MNKLLLLVAVSLVGNLAAFGHGENKKGPFGGYIQMPGVFHTELVPDRRDKSYHIFLTDIEFKNPTVKDSSIDMTYEKDGKTVVKFKCEVMGGNHFHCIPNKDYSKDSGTLILNTTRLKQKGVAKYELPLKLKGATQTPEPADSGHGHH